MRVVGQGHQFHPETGLCRRCELPMNDDRAKHPCVAAPRSPHPAPSTKVPNPYLDSKKQ